MQVSLRHKVTKYMPSKANTETIYQLSRLLPYLPSPPTFDGIFLVAQEHILRTGNLVYYDEILFYFLKGTNNVSLTQNKAVNVAISLPKLTMLGYFANSIIR